MIRGMLMTQFKITSVVVLAAVAVASFGVVALGGGRPDRPLPAASATTAVLGVAPDSSRSGGIRGELVREAELDHARVGRKDRVSIGSEKG